MVGDGRANLLCRRSKKKIFCVLAPTSRHSLACMIPYLKKITKMRTMKLGVQNLPKKISD